MSDIKYNNKWFKSGLELLNEVLYGKWKFIIIWSLIQKPLRFSDLRKNIPAITDRMLSLQLKELEEEGFIERIISEGTPAKVDYSLTKKAHGIIPALEQLEAFGRNIVDYKKPDTSTNTVASKIPLSLNEEQESFFDQL
jgi:DNA-binding HxlR family transcriptional regulator